MSAESHSQQPAPDFDFTVFSGDGTVYRHWKGGEFITKVEAETYNDPTDPPAPLFTFEHDKQKRLFILKWPDGRTEHFRDNPARPLIRLSRGRRFFAGRKTARGGSIRLRIFGVLHRTVNAERSSRRFAY